MKLNYTSHWLKTILLLLSMTVSATTWAMGDLPKRDKVNAVASKSTTSGNYYWYDGKRKRTILQDTGVVAELITPGAGSVLKSRLASAKAVGKQTSAVVKLWDVSATGDSKQSLSALGATMKDSLSPVFTSGKSGGGQRRALPGGILVTFKPGWSEKKVKQWVGEKGLSIRQKMNFGNIYLLDSAPGLDSLNLANSIYESGEVEGASPNWWQELRPL